MTTPDFRLDDKVAIVTGASKGIGQGLARLLAGAGARVALVSRHAAELEDLAAEITATGGDAAAFSLDVRDVGRIGDVFETIRTRFGRIDILVNNAGLGDNHPAEEVTEAAWDEMMDVNLKGAFFAAQAAGRIMLAQGAGRIVNMSSQAGSVGIRDHAVYCATKGGVEQFTRVLALEWGHRGVTVNAVAPTFIRTPGTAERLDRPDYLKSVLDRIPIGRVGTIEDVAGAVIYLASAAGAMVNGEVLKVDGGWTAQ
ncbi:MAG TPA: SDR family oxidoreductase [Devosiaceae bacterium]|jgi:2-deoxy-D-gluconate 3-dehydrogenase|nr:SDR family oxidoreductase [Devosiaceae bacterium]